MQTNHLLQNHKNYKTLAAWLQGGRFPHAILIDGPKGSGRTTFAKEIAATILCTGEEKPCGVCSHCVKVAKDIHPDFLTYQGEGGARSFHISKVRDIREEAWVSPNDGDRKVFLLLHGEELSVQAQNALLKLIEEPPNGVFFILTCENKDQMLPTIRSRMAMLTMEIPSVEDTIKILPNFVPDKPMEDYEKAALRALGNVGLAIELLEQESESPIFNQAQTFWKEIKQGNELNAMSISASFERNKESFGEFLTVLRSCVTKELLAVPTQGKAFYKASTLQLSQIIDIIDRIAESISKNTNMLLLVTILPKEIRQIWEHQ